VLKVLPDRDRVIVEGVNRVKRHQKPSQAMPQGGIIEKEMPIHVSNVMLLDTKSDKPTRVRAGEDKDGNKVRVSARSGHVLES
jgi:large subunit ribosomal protein L24